MTRVVRNATLFCVAGILVASAALANVPDPAHSTLSGTGFAVEGLSAGTPDNCVDGRCGNYLVTVRDFGGNIIAGSAVVIDFSGCSDINIGCTQASDETFLSGKKVSGTTNASGQFTFRVIGGATQTPPGADTSPGTKAGVTCATLYADGVPLGNLVVSAYDVNSLGSATNAAVNASDVGSMISEALKVIGGGTSRARADYNFSGSTNSGDTGIMITMALQQGAGTGSRNTAPYCP